MRGSRQRHPTARTAADFAGQKVDNASAYVFDPAPVDDDSDQGRIGPELAAMFRAIADQNRDLSELVRRPQPVIVRPSTRVTFPSGTLVSGAQPVRIIDQSPDRLRVTIRNTSAGTSTITLFLVAGLSTALATGGFPLESGDAITLDTRAPIAAYAVGGNASWAAVAEFIDATRGLD